jgi:hypothetical protein
MLRPVTTQAHATATAAIPASMAGAGRVLGNGAIFLAALILSCAVIGRCLPFPEVQTVHDKLEHLSRHGNEYDVIFLGSSHVYFQIMPAIFDRTAAENGVTVRSFNAGISAMMPPEDGYLMDQILRRPHDRLRWAVIECMPVSPRSERSLSGTTRESYWHDWTRTRILARSFAQDWAAVQGPLTGRAQSYGPLLSQAGESLRLFAENTANLGRGGVMLSHWMGSAKMKKASWPNRRTVGDGWISPPGEQQMSGKVRSDYERGFSNLQESTDHFMPGDPASEEALHGMLEKLVQNGVTPLLMIPPTTQTKRYRSLQPATTLDFSDAREYPEFFTLENRLDGGHLNVAGAEVFTRTLARLFVEKTRERTTEL